MSQPQGDPVLGSVEALELMDAAAGGPSDAGKAVDEPWYVTRLLVLALLRQYKRLSNRNPRRLFIPKAVEVALTIDARRNLNIKVGQPGDPTLRSLKQLFGCHPVWDAPEVRVE